MITFIILSDTVHMFTVNDVCLHSVFSGRIITTCLPPVSTEGLTPKDVDDLTERVRQQMALVFEKISREVEQDYYTKGKEAKS